VPRRLGSRNSASSTFCEAGLIDRQQFQDHLRGWITAPDLWAAARSIGQDPTVVVRRAELALRASGSIQQHEARLIRDIMEEGLRGLRLDPAAIRVARELAPLGLAKSAAWDTLGELAFAGRIHALSDDEIARHKDHPVIGVYDVDVLIDLIWGPAIMLMVLVESHLDIWRPQARASRHALYLATASHPLAIYVEGRVAAAFGFEMARRAGAEVHVANVRYGFVSVAGRFPEDFDDQRVEAARRLARDPNLPGNLDNPGGSER
jgi:hypothetical protein